MQWPTGDWRPLAIDKFGQIGWVQQEGSGKTGRNSTIISAAGLGTALAFGQRCDTDCKNMNGIKAMQILATDQTNFYFSDVNVQITFKQMGRTFTNNGAVFLGFHYARASDWPDTIADSGAETGVATMSMMLQPPPCALQPENWYQWNGSDYGTAPINSLVPESSDDIDVNGSYPYVYATDVNAATQFLISVNDANAVIDMMPINFSNINGEFVSDYVLAVFDYKNRGTHYDSAENVYRCILVVENGQLFVMDGNDPPHRANLVDFALDSSVLWYDYDNLKAFCNAYMK